MFKLETLCFFVCLLVNLSTQQQPLKVSVYYESLCPDSIRFITRQLTPSYSQLADFIDVDFVPYGKAIHNLVDGQWVFSCQHGASECYGNKMQACALNQNSTEAKNVDFVNCVMGQSNPSADSAMENCAQSNGAISWDDIVACRDDGTADNLLAGYGDRTHALEPQISFVPTIIYNDVYNKTNQDSSLVDFLWTACNQLGDNKPSSCPAQRRTSKWGRHY